MSKPNIPGPLTEAQQQLVLDYMYIVDIVAKEYPGRWFLSDEEIHSAACVGLIHACLRYVPERIRTFELYANKCIRGYVVTEFHRRHLIAIPNTGNKNRGHNCLARQYEERALRVTFLRRSSSLRLAKKRQIPSHAKELIPLEADTEIHRRKMAQKNLPKPTTPYMQRLLHRELWATFWGREWA